MASDSSIPENSSGTRPSEVADSNKHDLPSSSAHTTTTSESVKADKIDQHSPNPSASAITDNPSTKADGASANTSEPAVDTHSSSAHPSSQQPVTQTTDTHGNLIQSNDPTTRKDAPLKEKLVGNLKGAIHGTVGSLQAATGSAIRNKAMEEKGLEKMSDEDNRLGAISGVPPVGSGRRNTAVDPGDAAAAAQQPST